MVGQQELFDLDQNPVCVVTMLRSVYPCCDDRRCPGVDWSAWGRKTRQRRGSGTGWSTAFPEEERLPHPGLLLSGREKQEVVDCKTCRGSYLLLQTLEKQNLHDTDFTGFFLIFQTHRHITVKPWHKYYT